MLKDLVTILRLLSRHASHQPIRIQVLTPHERSTRNATTSFPILNSIIALATVINAFAFIFITYINERAYLHISKSDGRSVSTLPNNRGLQVKLKNDGRTSTISFKADAWLLQQQQVVSVENERQSHADTIVTGDDKDLFVSWPQAVSQIAEVKSGQRAMAILQRIYYRDAFHISHCLGVKITYRLALFKSFTAEEMPALCDRSIKAYRFNRVCVKFSDGEGGAFIDSLEGFSTTGSQPQVADPDIKPCLKTLETSE